MEANCDSIENFRAPYKFLPPWFTAHHLLPLAPPQTMENFNLNEPINWDEIKDFEGEARHFAGDYFFEVESDEGEVLVLVLIQFLLVWIRFMF
jgi:hypothetical protein